MCCVRVRGAIAQPRAPRPERHAPAPWQLRPNKGRWTRDDERWWCLLIDVARPLPHFNSTHRGTVDHRLPRASDTFVFFTPPASSYFFVTPPSPCPGPLFSLPPLSPANLPHQRHRVHHRHDAGHETGRPPCGPVRVPPFHLHLVRERGTCCSDDDFSVHGAGGVCYYHLSACTPRLRHRTAGTARPGLLRRTPRAPPTRSVIAGQ